MKNVTRKHKVAGEEFLFPNPDTTIRLPWDGQNKYWWNEVCADVVEVFGLPGDRFTSHPTPNYMDFHFKTKKDADLCRILLSEKI
jgi:hypothetical protein